jgi:hypothetical protein
MVQRSMAPRRNAHLKKERFMSRQIANLQHLLAMLRARYGDEDGAALEVAAQLKALEDLESKDPLRTRLLDNSPREAHMSGPL